MSEPAVLALVGAAVWFAAAVLLVGQWRTLRLCHQILAGLDELSGLRAPTPLRPAPPPPPERKEA